MLLQPNTTAQDPFCASQIVMISQGVSSVAIRPLNPLDKNSLVNVIYQVTLIYTTVQCNALPCVMYVPSQGMFTMYDQFFTFVMNFLTTL